MPDKTIENLSSESKPLYLLVDQGQHKNMQLQVSDRETAAHFLQVENPPLIPITDIFPDFEHIDLATITDKIPKAEWFKATGHEKSIHGQRHLARVLIYSVILGKLENLNKKQSDRTQTAAALHDIGRVDDRTDPGHGEASGDWILENFQTLNNNGYEIEDGDLNTIKVLTTFHEVPFGAIPNEIRQSSVMDELSLVRAADALDRYRLPSQKWWPNVEYLSLDTSKKLLSVAKYLTLNTENDTLADGYDFVDSLEKRLKELKIIK